MAEEAENWDEHSEDGIHKTQTSASDHNSEERASGGDSVALPCGHQRPAHYIIAWFKHYLKQRQTEFTCPGFNAGQKKTCGVKLSYQDICRLIPLTSKQREFLEEKLCLLTAGKLCDFKACPGCLSLVERRDESNLCVHCTICTAIKKQTYTFCWSCLREWKGPTHNAVRCGNEDCGRFTITEDSLVPCSPKFKQEKLREMGHKIYPMKDKSSDRKRLALLINNVEFEDEDQNRVGADKDESRMERLLKGLGYTVVTLRDLTAQGMKCAMKDFAQRQEHFQSDSCFVVFMSHGNDKGISGVSLIRNSDEDIFSIDEIFNSLNTPNCPGLRDKPKIILIQSCRGGKDGCVEVQDSVPKQEHIEKDFCCLRSCTPDTVSYRTESGSDFFKDIVEVFNQHACEDEILELFRKVMSLKFKENHPRQMPCIDRTTLSKKVYLFPGL
ncbi:caspase a-like [Megalobrama amblycephala]|uniref:caspase a-like n=1 Tax=Megalobrama amblycephala TaxID=75352 RepID=UPI00201453D9|nr:caspase a-like [Megalobrama amblycephala]